MSACRSCRATVRWVVTDKGKLMPLDPDPRDDGNIVFTGRWRSSKAGRAPEVRYETADELPGLEQPARYASHFATCPQSAGWRCG